MRLAAPLFAFALALLALAPGALAQRTTTVQMAAPSAPLVPLAPPVEIPIVVTTDCAPENAASGIQVSYAVTRLPPWARATIAPATGRVQYADCATAGRAEFHAIMSVSATQDAPAFTPDTMEVTVRRDSATLSGPSGSATSTLPITAAYFSILDAQADTTPRSVLPRQVVVFPIKFTNLGNGNTRLAFDASERDVGVYPAAPAPIILASKQAGGADGVSKVVNVQAYRMSNATRATQFTLRYHSNYALDPKLTGQDGALTFRLVPRDGTAIIDETNPSPPPADAKPKTLLDKFSPAPSLPLALVPLAVAALFFRGRVKRAG